MNPRNMVLAAVSVLVVVTLIGYQALSGSYNKDEQAEKDLTALAEQVSSYYDQHSHLPAKLTDLKVSDGVQNRLGRYQYNVKKSTEFELCATFAHSKSSTSSSNSVSLATASTSTALKSGTTISSQVSNHDTGKSCFTESVYGSFYDDINAGSSSASSSQLRSTTNSSSSSTSTSKSTVTPGSSGDSFIDDSSQN